MVGHNCDWWDVLYTELNLSYAVIKSLINLSPVKHFKTLSLAVPSIATRMLYHILM